MEPDDPTVTDEVLLSERIGHVLVLTLNRPRARNALNPELKDAILQAMAEADGDPGIRAVVVTGNGPVFCAGMDLKAFAGGAAFGGLTDFYKEGIGKPLIAALNGPALGGGFEIALACDLVVASRTARFALPESRRGVVASSGALFRAMRALPLNVARELLITGAVLDAERGYQLGFVNRVTEPGGALAAALELAEDVCASSPVSVAASLAALAAQHDAADATGWDVTAEAVERVTASDDISEGVTAFLEKRPPLWSGR